MCVCASVCQECYHCVEINLAVQKINQGNSLVICQWMFGLWHHLPASEFLPNINKEFTISPLLVSHGRAARLIICSTEKKTKNPRFMCAFYSFFKKRGWISYKCVLLLFQRGGYCILESRWADKARGGAACLSMPEPRRQLGCVDSGGSRVAPVNETPVSLRTSQLEAHTPPGDTCSPARRECRVLSRQDCKEFKVKNIHQCLPRHRAVKKPSGKQEKRPCFHS